MQENKIEIRKIWYPLNKQPFLVDYQLDGINSLELYNSSCCLPSSTGLSIEQLDFVYRKMTDFEIIAMK